jgi:hypothetical protein
MVMGTRRKRERPEAATSAFTRRREIATYLG